MDLSRLQLTTGQKSEAEQGFKRLTSFRGYEAVYALFLFEDGRKEEAVKELERRAKEDPSDRPARTRLVAAYRAVNRPQDAKKVLQEALKKNGRDNDALLQRGEIYLAEQQYPDAEADFNQVLKAMPASAEVHYLLAKLNQARANLLTYRQELFSALQLSPSLLAVRVELAQSLLQNKDARTALNLCNEAPEAQRNTLPLVIQRNWALWFLGDVAEMRKGIDQGLAQGRSVDLLIQDGMWKLRSNNPAGARAALEAALKINPADLRALQGLHQTYLAQKDGAGALQRVKEYAAQQPKSAPVQDFLGLLLASNGNKTEARAAFTTAKAADPRFVPADLSLVQMDAAEGKTEEAIRRLETVLKDDGSNLTARRWAGNLEATRGNHDAAIEQFRKVVAADPNDAQAANNLAYLLVEYRNEHDVALKMAQRAVDLNPNAPEFCDTLGWVLYRKGVYNSAIPYFERASANPQNVVWKYHLAMAYAKAGNLQRGKAVLDAAAKVNSNVPEAKLAKELLQSAQ
jgi:tetratricopeptide (TPR) repeat protein